MNRPDKRELGPGLVQLLALALVRVSAAPVLATAAVGTRARVDAPLHPSMWHQRPPLRSHSPAFAYKHARVGDEMAVVEEARARP